MLLACFAWPCTAQSVTYQPMNTAAGFPAAINLSKPVGSLEGAAGVSPSGAASFTVAIKMAPGTDGMVPAMSLNYSSQAGNGILGYGWSLGGLSAIARAGQNNWHNGNVTPVTVTNADNFLLDGMLLAPLSGANGVNGTIYGTDAESYAQITSMGTISGSPQWFRVWAKDGSILEYGNTSDSRVMDQSGHEVMMWRLNRKSNLHGNYIDFKYNTGIGEPLIDEIWYTGNSNISLAPYSHIKFHYANNRIDENTLFEAGTQFAFKHLLTSIDVYTENNQFVRTYAFEYANDNVHSFLQKITEYGLNGKSYNSTDFLYEHMNTNLDAMISISSGSLSAPNGSAPETIAGDFNGDGLTDILQRNIQLNNNAIYTTSFSVKLKDPSSNSFTSSLAVTVPSSSPGQIIEHINVPNSYNYHVNDFDGDGTDDILVAYRQASGGTFANVLSKVDIITKISASGAPAPTSFTPPSGFIYAGLAPNCVYPGDFDGDGRMDFMMIVSNNPGAGSGFKAFITSPGNNWINEEIIFTPADFGNVQYPADLINAARYANIIDFNGDGKHDLFFTRHGTIPVSVDCSYVVSFIRNAATQKWTAIKLYDNPYPNQNYQIYFGDFNGDRQTDLLTRDNSSQAWQTAMADGTTWLSPQSFAFNTPPNVPITPSPYAYSDYIILSDFNADGRTDIMHEIDGTSSTNLGFDIYYAKTTIGLNSSFYRVSNTSSIAHNPQNVVGDYNGDGKPDLLVWGGIGNWAIQTFGAGTADYKLLQIRDGFGNSTKFIHDYLTNPFAATGFYTTGGIASSYPLNVVNAPICAVQEFQIPDGNGGVNKTQYSYTGALLHKGGKGFLGFAQFNSRNLASGFEEETETQLHPSMYVPLTIDHYQWGPLSGISTLVSSKHTQFKVIPLGGPQRYKQELDFVQDNDHLKNTWVKTSYQYDAFSNPTNILVDQYTVQQEETQISYAPVSLSNTPVPSQPKDITEARVSGALTRTTTFNISSGLVRSKTEFSGLPLAVTTAYNYNAVGELLTTSTSASGVTTRPGSVVTDSKGRLPASVSNAANQSESYIYDWRWGVPLSHTGIDGLTTTYDYDDFGRLIKATAPDGNIFTTSIFWNAISAINSKYTIISETPGQSYTLTHRDALGRVKRTETAIWETGTAPHLTPVFTLVDKTYNALGNLSTETQPHFASETSGWLTTTYTYDGLNRPWTISNGVTSSTNTYNYFYDPLFDNVAEVSTTNSAGQHSSVWTDAAGRTCRTIDDGGDVTVLFNEWNQVSRRYVNGPWAQHNTYDQYGRMTEQSDADAGRTQYAYNAFGELTQQTDAKGNVQTTLYNKLGQPTVRSGPEGTTNYIYNNAGPSINQLQSITSFGTAYSEGYAYDAYGRLSNKIETIAGTGYTTHYTYDSYGRLATTDYPGGGPTITNEYNSFGGLVNVRRGWISLSTLQSINGRGQPLTVLNGNGITTSYAYTNGAMTSKIAPGIQDYALSYDFSTFNVIDRYDNIKGLRETFSYDALNRLGSATVKLGSTSYTAQTVGYDIDATSSATVGNIVSKSDVGAYKYFYNHPHAVGYIDNAANNISLNTQDIQYNGFLRPSTITENNLELRLSYGYDYERRKTELWNTTTNALQETRLYLGNGTEQHIDAVASTTRKIYYIPGPDGLAAIIFDENGSESTYFPYVDHLGSIQALTNDVGDVLCEQAFDAWGWPRSPIDWTTAEWTGPTQWSWLRGFTGHEHLPQFGLINMNARLYDPLNGRMLSADNYVQSSDYTQNYNRYSYCWNNPLKYTDPSGNVIGGPFFALAFLSELGSNIFGGKSNAFSNAWDMAGRASGEVGSLGQIPIYQNGNTTVSAGLDIFNLGISANYAYQDGDFSAHAGIGFGLLGGFSASGGVSEKLHLGGDKEITLGLGAGTNFSTYSISGGATYDNGRDFNVGYAFNFYGGQKGPGYEPQNTGAFSVGTADFHFGLENDFLARPERDRWRTQSLEIGAGPVSLSSQIYTNDPSGEGKGQDKVGRPSGFWGFNKPSKKGYTSWVDGEVYLAPLTFQYRYGNSQVSRIGFSASGVQDFQQNWIHQNLPFGRQNYYLNYEHLYSGAYSFGGFLNAYSQFPY